ncbi:phosphoribosylanthranilate isomerase [Rhizobium sp. SSA_523]|uniref:phosphoribosylanthranilate isomerase n=1 Tax=Rhizobium sp. SSA_523 TaxID=2952477 RepID=UPI002091DC90|nr:phosphoribosylanthranilate isomerase [Rhizobium sp. SSA_523]MCO5734635.1 phosphoribosylanthranilate isomerase [Rhizobium sp. SSA_523]WKC23408.1 phosphoribosylanthranilate isomerase [Rhizobium sp. SSA_523]
MTPDIKICGLKTAEAIDLAVARGANHIGFIFFEKSPRNIDALTAASLADRVRGRAKIVAVTVNADNEELEEIIAYLKPDILQLHGAETPERVLNVKAMFGLPVIKAVSVRTREDLRTLSAYEGLADRFLLDAKAPHGSDLPGGNGVSFDWTILSALDGNVDYMLSGGLNAENAGEALTLTGARGLDLSSGVESAPGVKDPAKINAFFDAIDQWRANESQGVKS